MTRDLSELIAAHFSPHPPERLGVAVSGGGDSMALLVALAEWGGAALRAVTVDHGLRPEAAAEAEMVAALCTRLGVPHDVVHWQEGWDGTGNLMQAAREARYRLIADWAAAQAIADVALGHTQDDLAETLIMRLGRGAGIDGLAAMAAVTTHHGIRFHRPVLRRVRAELRAMLEGKGIGWSEDPSNDDLRFDRARVRAALTALEVPLDALAQSALHLRDAREALGACAVHWAREHVQLDAGDVLIDHQAFRDLPREMARRVMQAAVAYVGAGGYGPRGAAMTAALEAVDRGEDSTLQGCRLLHRRQNLRVTREWQAVAALRGPTDAVWDGRWRAIGPDAGCDIAALGEAGLPLCPDRKATGRPAASLIASPAIWRGTELIAAPLAGLENGWRVQILRDRAAFEAALR